MNARDSIENLWDRATPVGPLLDAYRLAVIAERDAQIIAWLEKKAREEGSSNKERRSRAEVLFRMADKMSRGAVRPPLSKGPDATPPTRSEVLHEAADLGRELSRQGYSAQEIAKRLDRMADEATTT
ncbi:hypothetical protein [Streptomyces sp. rh34]|uniref:hypothetical protein n=1 Tax=Streptomyces sp. rh34 TaxID=2034272 RepID=UPI000BF092D9|nr:hypothetical protein [Streptomyces sp. rh34]